MHRRKQAFFLVFASGLLQGIAGFLLLFSGMSCGGDMLTESSRTAECGEDLLGALHAFRRDMDMPFQIDQEDYKYIFQTGKIEKEYFRDGVKIKASFHLRKTSNGCDLKFYKRGRSEPGQYSSTSGNYGSVSLSKCECM